MKTERNKSLKHLNTFGIDATATEFVDVESLETLLDVLKNREKSLLILGGGSNVLFTGDVDAVVAKNNIRGIEILKEDEAHVWVKSFGGENWHSLVLYTIDKNLQGIENLSLIPGSVGAAPMQNIGAYGVELKEVFESLEAVNLETGKVEVFDNKSCKFGYRESVFKRDLKGKYFIYSVTLKLNKQPQFNTSYGAIQETLAEMGVETPTVKAISDAVIHIRQSKLPDPAELGNAGSFFKNPEVEKKQFDELQKEYPTIPHYPLPGNKVKIPAAWLIEQSGWKGKRVGNTGSHKQQALVLVNYGGATGEEILQLSRDIQYSVQRKFGILLSPEVNVV